MGGFEGGSILWIVDKQGTIDKFVYFTPTSGHCEFFQCCTNICLIEYNAYMDIQSKIQQFNRIINLTWGTGHILIFQNGQNKANMFCFVKFHIWLISTRTWSAL